MPQIYNEDRVSKASISKWCREFSKECQLKGKFVPKKSSGILCKGNKVEIYSARQNTDWKKHKYSPISKKFTTSTMV